jgi:HPt (histidine-containing phosphotransfer) domain-containing protein
MAAEVRNEVVDALRDIIGDEAIRDLIVSYVEDSARLITQLSGETANAASAAHQLSSTSAALGAESLAALCSKIEQAIRTDGTPPTAAQRQEVEQCVGRVHAELRAYLA